MIRSFVLGMFLVLTAAQSCSAQQWARKMFKISEHDFGAVARYSKAEFSFEMTNLYEEDVHIASVRSSCGCTEPRISKHTLKTWEKGAIIANYNTRSFLGRRSATLTVVIDRPYYAEVQLSVSGYIRSDVVFNPGVVELGEVDQGSSLEKTVSVSYAGRSDWKIVDVRSANPSLEVELREPQREFGRTQYEMLIRVKPDAPAGYIHSELRVVTNDRQLESIPLSVEGRILSPLTVSPASLFLGVVQPGQTVTKNLIVRGKTPFKVVDVKCNGDCFEVTLGAEAKKLHVIPIKFTAGDDAGKVVEKIQIRTDIGKGVTAACTASATVSAGQHAEKAE